MSLPLPWAPGPSREQTVFDNLRDPGVRPWNLLAVSDPDVQLIDGRWTMLLGAFQNRFRVRLVQARLPEGAPLDDPGWHLPVTNALSTAVTLANPPRGSFDTAGMGSPAFASGIGLDGAPVRRIYYNALDRLFRSPQTFCVGVLEATPDGGWRRRAAPALRGDRERPSALEPCVRYADNRWHLWYLSFVEDPPSGQPPDYRIRYTWSADGLRGWSDPVEIFDQHDNYFDVDVRPWRDGWLMVIAGDPHADQAPQGLWVAWSSDPGDREQWRRTIRPLLVHEDAAPDWRRRGVYGPTIASVTDDELVVFASGHYGRIDWLAEARQRVRARRLPTPPFGDWYLSVTRLHFSAGQAP